MIHLNYHFQCGKFQLKLILEFERKTHFSLLLERFPFDPKNLTGYSIAVIIEYIILFYEYFIDTCTVSLGIGAFYFAISATDEVQYILHSINDRAKASENQSSELKILLAEFIDAHVATKQLSV